ncbi:hypothetical protein [Sporosarcina sp. ACRSL]|uniref:hypothetical protein n=1 Tax=Sporosarcina sp. ACRSL TaxID=2918215 RepID=UPI001EF50B68|nr:hypothetical protein [Sporosarcina sp. ACRSL]
MSEVGIMQQAIITPEERLAGPVLILIGALVSLTGLFINFHIALTEYRTGTSTTMERPLY